MAPPSEPEVAAPTVSETLTAHASPRPSAPAPERDRLRDVYRGGFGVALIGGAALIVLSFTGALDSLGDAVLTIVVVVLALGLVLAPFWWRLGRNLSAERAERIRSQERADMAAHIHDSVLQTLTLVQKRADDPRAVAQLARAQERELRGWLFTGDRAPASASLAAALEDAAAEVEDAHRVPIEVVAVGDAPVGDAANALVGAAREAMVNAAKFAPDAGEVAVYAELAPARSQVFVRDRGDGFDPEAVPEDRRGVRESIIGEHGTLRWLSPHPLQRGRHRGRAHDRTGGGGHNMSERPTRPGTKRRTFAPWSSSTTTRCFARASARSSRAWSRSWATRLVEEAVRLIRRG